MPKISKFFKKRIPEPEEMENEENQIFHDVAKKNYSHWFPPLVDDLLARANIKRGMILDIGCGPGFLVKELAQRSRYYKVTGIDLSVQTISLAKHNCRGLKNVILKVSSAYNLPFPDNSLDLVVCRDSFHQFGNPVKALKEMKRVLKHKHLLYIQDLRRDLPRYLLKMALPQQTVFQKIQYSSAQAAYLKMEMNTLMRKAYFKKVSIFTRKMTSDIRKNCMQRKINETMLRSSFQAHYVALGRK